MAPPLTIHIERDNHTKQPTIVGITGGEIVAKPQQAGCVTIDLQDFLQDRYTAEQTALYFPHAAD